MPPPDTLAGLEEGWFGRFRAALSNVLRWRKRGPQTQPEHPNQLALPTPEAPVPLDRRQVAQRLRELYGRVRASSNLGMMSAPGNRPGMFQGPRGSPSAPELPLPIPLEMVQASESPQEQALKILRHMRQMMDGTDEKVVRDIHRAVDNARDTVTTMALDQFTNISDGELMALLTDRYQTEFQAELERLAREQLDHMQRFHQPTPLEQALEVDPAIERRHGRLPRYLKWLLTHHPDLERDPQILGLLRTIEQRLWPAPPPTPVDLQDYAQEAFTKSLYLNPEIAVRVLRAVARDRTAGRLDREAVRAELETELRQRGALPATTVEEPPPHAVTGDTQRTLQAEVEQLQQQREQYREDVERLGSDRQRLQMDLAKLSEERDAVAAEIGRLGDVVQRAQRETANIKAQHGAVEATLEQAQQELAETQAHRGEVETALTTAQRRLVTLQADASERQTAIDEVRQRAEAVEQRLAHLHTTHRELERTLAEAVARKQALDREIEQLTARRDALRKAVEGLSEQHDTVEHHTSELSQANERLDRAESEVRSLQKARDRLQEERQVAQHDRDQASSALDAATGENRRLQERLAEVQRELQAARAQEVALQRQVEAAQAVASHAQQQGRQALQDAERKLLEANALQRELASRREEMGRQLVAVQVEHRRLTEEIGAQRRLHESLGEAIAEARGQRVAETRHGLMEVNALIAEQQRRIQELQEALQELRLSWYEARQSKEETVEGTLTATIQGVEGQLQRIKDDLAKAMERRSHYETNLSVLPEAGLEETHQILALEAFGEAQLPYRQARAQIVRLTHDEEAHWVDNVYGLVVRSSAVPLIGALAGLAIGGALLLWVLLSHPEWYHQAWSWDTTNYTWDEKTARFIPGKSYLPMSYVILPGIGIGMPLLGAGVAIPITYYVIQPLVNYTRLLRKRSRFPDTYRLLMEVINTKDDVTVEASREVAAAFSHMDDDLLEPILRYWYDHNQQEKIQQLAGQAREAKLTVPLLTYYDAKVAAIQHVGLHDDAEQIDQAVERARTWLTEQDRHHRNFMPLLSEVLPTFAKYAEGSKDFIYLVGYCTTTNSDLTIRVWEGGAPAVNQFIEDLAEERRTRLALREKFGPAFDKAFGSLWDFLTAVPDFAQRYHILRELLPKIAEISRNGEDLLGWVRLLIKRVPPHQWSGQLSRYSSYQYGSPHQPPARSPAIVSIFEQYRETWRVVRQAFDRIAPSGQDRNRLEEAFDALSPRLNELIWEQEVQYVTAIVPEVVMTSRSVDECCARLKSLAALDNQLWKSGKDRMLQFVKDTMSYEHAVEDALREARVPPARIPECVQACQQLAGRAGSHNVNPLTTLKDVLPSVAKTARDPDQFLYWLGQLETLPAQTWRGGGQTVLQAFDAQWGLAQARDRIAAELGTTPAQREAIIQQVNVLYQRLGTTYPGVATTLKDAILTVRRTSSSAEDFQAQFEALGTLGDGVWSDPQAVVSAHTALRGYEQIKEQVAVRIGRARNGQGAVRQAIASLERDMDRRRLTAINLRRRVIEKLAEAARDPKAFVFWTENLGRLGSGLFDVVARDFDVVLALWQEEPGRDWIHFCDACVLYQQTYHELVAMTPHLVKTLTEPGVSLAARVEQARAHLFEQKLAKLGVPSHLVNLREPVQPDDLIKVAGGEGVVRSRLQLKPVQATMEKMGQDGLWTYYESAQPTYYQQFWSELAGFPRDFREPGEKFRIAYDARAPTSPLVPSDLLPIRDPVDALATVLTDLQRYWPSLYDNAISAKRELIGTRTPREYVTAETVDPIARRLLAMYPSWSAIPWEERVTAMVILLQVVAAQELSPLRARLFAQRDEFVRWRLSARYWESVKEQLRNHPKSLKPGSRAYKGVLDAINQRIARAAGETGAGREGLLQFYLSGGTFVDYFKGECSADCTKGDGLKFQETMSWAADPAFLLFKIMENGKWVGNIYSAIFKDANGKTFLFLDSVQIKIGHTLDAGARESYRKTFAEGFENALLAYLGNAGFDYLVVAGDPSTRDKIRSLMQQTSTRLGGTSETIQAHKVGGLGYLKEFGFSSEYIQGTGTIASGTMTISGTKVSVPRVDRELQRKQQELQELLDVVVRMEGQQRQLEARLIPVKAEFQELQAGYNRARLAGRTAVLAVLRKPLAQKRTDAEKLEDEVRETLAILNVRKEHAARLSGELDQLQGKGGQSAGLEEEASQPSQRVLTGLFAGAGLLSSPSIAHAQSIGQDPLELLLLPLIIVMGGLAGVAFLWEFWRWVTGSREQEERFSEWQASWRARLEQYRLPADVEALLEGALARVPQEAKVGLPSTFRLSIPLNVGIRRDRAVEVLRTVLTALQQHKTVMAFLERQPYYADFKARTTELGLRHDFDEPGMKRVFTAGSANMKLAISSRGPEDIIRGEISADCTALSASSFYNTIPQFLLDPGFLNFKVIQDGRWVGNLYLLVAEQEGRPVLIIDAVQLPPWRRTWPIHVEELADLAVGEVVAYAKEVGFQAVYMSRFTSNFDQLVKHFKQHPPVPTTIEKVGGFEHLKALGFWDPTASRNEYLETFSPAWNQALPSKVDPNEPKQTLLLRPIWQQEAPQGELQEAGLEERGLTTRSRGFTPSWRTALIAGWLAAATMLPAFGQRAEAGPPQRPQAALTMAAQAPRAPPIQLAQAPAPPLQQRQAAAQRSETQSSFNLQAATQQLTTAPYSKKIRPAQAARRGGRIHALVALRWNLQWAGYLKPWSGYGDLKALTPQQFEQALSREIAPAFKRYQADHEKQSALSKADREIQRILRTGKMSFKPFAPGKAQVGKPSEQPGVHPPVSKAPGPPTVSAQAEATKRQAELKRLDAERAKQESALKHLQEERQKSQGDVERLRKEQQELATKVQALKEDAERLRQEARKPVGKAEERTQTLQRQVEQLETRKRQAEQGVNELEARRAAAQQDLKHLGEEQARLREALAQAKEGAERAQTERQRLQQGLGPLEQQHQQKAEELRKLETQHQTLSQDIRDLQRQKRQLGQDLQTLRQQLEDLQRRLAAAGKKAELPLWKQPKAVLVGLFFLTLSGVGGFLAGTWYQRRRMRARAEALEAQVQALQQQVAEAQAAAGSPPPPSEPPSLVEIPEALRAQARAAGAGVQAVHADPERLAESMVSYLLIPSPTGDEDPMREQLKEELRQLFGEDQAVLLDRSDRPKNLVVEINATPGYEHLPPIGFDAHTDVNTPDPNPTVDTEARRIIQQGIDDKAAIAAMIEAVRTLRERGVPHRRIRLFFTAEEEHGFHGARWIVENRPDLLRDLHLLLPIDGPLEAGNPCAVKWLNLGRGDPRAQVVLEAGRSIGGGRDPIEFTFSLGNEREYARVTTLPVVHLRANYEAMHSRHENIDARYLTVLADWLVEIVLQLDQATVGPQVPPPAASPTLDAAIHQEEARLRALAEERERLERILTELRAEAERAQRAAEAARQDQARVLEEQVTAQSELDAAQTQLEMARQATQREAEEAEQQRQALQAEVDMLERSRQERQRELGTLQQQVEDASQRLAATQTAASELETQQAETASALGRLRQEAEAAEGRIGELGRERDTLQREIGQLREETSRLQGLARQAEEAVAQIEKGQARLQTEAVAEQERRAHETAERLLETRRELATTELTLQETRQRVVEAQLELEQTRQSLETMTRQRDDMGAAGDAAQARLTQEIGNLAARRSELAREVEQTQRRLTEAQAALHAVRGDVQSLEMQRAELAVSLPTLEQDRQRLAQEVAALRRERDELQTAVRELRETEVAEQAVEREEVERLMVAITQLGPQIERNRELAARGAMTSDMEYVVAVPNEPVRWVAYRDGRWGVYEQGHRTADSIVDRRGRPVTDPQLVLHEATVLLSNGRREPLFHVLRMPPVPRGFSVAEAGGFLMLRGNEVFGEVFPYKGFIAPRFFVHPGDEVLAQKQIRPSQLLPNHYEAAKAIHPGSRLLLGWHSHPEGAPELGRDDEEAIRQAYVERHYELVFSPQGVALWRYWLEGDQLQKIRIFTARSAQQWQRDLLGELGGQRAGLEESPLRRFLQRVGNAFGGGQPAQPAIDRRAVARRLADELRFDGRREAATQELIQLGGIETVDALLPRLLDPDPNIRVATARTLIAIGESADAFSESLLTPFLATFGRDQGQVFLKAVFVGSVVERIGLPNLSPATLRALVPHVLQYFPLVGDPYHPILTGLRQVNAITDQQANRAIEARGNRFGFPSFQEGDVLVTYLGYPIFKGMDVTVTTMQETRAKEQGLPLMAFDVWDEDYERHGDGYTLATAQGPGPMGPQEFLWVLLGERLPAEYLRDAAIRQRIESNRSVVWKINEIPYLRPVFNVEGLDVVPVGVSVTGDRAFYQDLGSGLMIACCVQFQQAERNVRAYRESFQDMRDTILPYRESLDSVARAINEIRVYDSARHQAYFTASDAPPLHRLGGAALTEVGKRWLTEEFGIPFHRLQFLIMLDEIARLVDLNALGHVRDQLKQRPTGSASATAPVSDEPAASHRRAIAKAFLHGPLPIRRGPLPPGPFPLGRPPFGIPPPDRRGGLEEQRLAADPASRQRAIDRLTEIGRPAVPVLLSVLGADNPGIRAGAAETLARIGDIRVLQMVQRASRQHPTDTSLVEAAARLEWLGSQRASGQAAQAPSPAFPDPFSEALFVLNTSGQVMLTEPASHAVPVLSVVESRLIIEIDAATVIGTEMGYPQMRGYGFGQMLTTLAQAADAEGLRSALTVRLINTNPELHALAIANALELSDTLNDLVEVVDVSAPQAVSSTIADLLTSGSIRVVLEGHEPLWGRADVVVRRPQQGQIVSMAGLLVAALAIAPRYYDSLSAFVKRHVQPLGAADGQIVLLPVPTSALSPTYLQNLEATNRRLRQMV